MRTHFHLAFALSASLLAFNAPAQAHQPESGLSSIPEWAAQTDRIIVKYRDEANGASTASAARSSSAHDLRTQRFGRMGLKHMRKLNGGTHVFKLARQHRLDSADMKNLLRELRQDPDVLYAEPDQRMFILRTPNDPYYNEQWHYHASAAGINLPKAWDLSLGEDVVVAVIDTGVQPHVDLKDRLLPGYDFISDPQIANDGDGREADASDPGDWLSAGECGYNYPRSDQPSSWHGTHVAGTIAAVGDNGIGVAGVAWKAKILPVRVLGKCGGYTSDIVDGMRWAAGLSVNGVPANPNPAKVLNLSLGGSGSCSTTYRRAIEEIRAAGATIVVAAGNESTNAANVTPASCPGVIVVAATDNRGGQAYYSNYGSVVDVSAPGGELTASSSSGGILSTYNAGLRAPGADSYSYLQGTSMAAPHVAGVVALMYAAKPTLRPDEAEQVLKDTARPFPALSTSDRCTTSKCGAGIVDAAAAVAAVAGTGKPENPQDTTPPSVKFSTPADGASLKGQVDVIIDASDDTGVEKVEVYINGQLAGTDSTEPYAFTWNTTARDDGKYTLTAKAYDAAGNSSSHTVTVTIANKATNGWVCREYYSSNSEHVLQGRATSNWFMMVYAKGSNAYIGYNSYFSYSRLAETAQGYFLPGSCP